MLRNAFAYITRKWPKSLLLFAIILLMGTLSLIGLSMKGATQKASSESQRRRYRKNQPGRGDHLLH